VEESSEQLIPLKEAVFRLQYAVGVGTRKTFLDQCLAPMRTAHPLTYDPMVANDQGAQLTAARIDFDDGCFSYTWSGADALPLTVSVAPWDAARLAEEVLPTAAGERLVRCASNVWSQLTADFDKAVASGRIVVVARIGELDAAPTALPAGSWPSVAVVNWAAGSGQAGGRYLFDIRATTEAAARAVLKTEGGALSERTARPLINLGRPAGRPAESSAAAMAALATLYPVGVPKKVSSKVLTTQINHTAKEQGWSGKPISETTCRRVAGRKVG
jgi:hypothetical protein